MPKVKWYAVRKGREGPKIYDSWEQCRAATSRYPGAIHKSFTAKSDAEKWIQDFLNVPRPPVKSLPPPIDILDLPPLPVPTPVPQPLPVDTPSVSLSPEQQKVLQRVLERKSVFFTGSAGTGKSVLLREIIRVLGGPHSPGLAITASTGIAGVNIGGCTLHSWELDLGKKGNGPCEWTHTQQGSRVRTTSLAKRKEPTQTLIIDEISMIDGRLFDKLENIARLVRRDDRPFGGITLVLSGDFFQLPPVAEKGEQGEAIPSIFTFEAQTWDLCIPEPTFLSKVFRQKEQTFVDLLNAMRFGRMDEAMCKMIYALRRPLTYTDGIEPTEIYPVKSQVEYANSTRLNKLTGPLLPFVASDYRGVDSNGERITREKMSRLVDRFLAPDRLHLKLGAQVMLVKNTSRTLVNGSVGKVVDFQKIREARHLLPLGQEPHLSAGEGRWPVVQFVDGQQVMIQPVEFTIENAQGDVEAKRTQVPLILAWALSVHKSQGQTLERVKVDLGRTFEKGQAYVALSRATKMETLEVYNFDVTKVVAHPRVIRWHQQMEENASKTTDFDFDFDDLMDDDFAIATY